MDELEQLAKDQKLRDLPRMGAKLEEKVLRSIAQYRLRTGRFLLSFARDTADELTKYLSELDGIEEITAAGSLRRGKDTVGDLDLLVTGPNAAAALDRFVVYPRVHEVLGRGANKASAKIGREGLQVDVRALPRESYGAGYAILHGQQGAQRRRAHARGENGVQAQRVWPLPRRGRCARGRRNRSRRFTRRSASPGFRPSCAKTPAKSRPPRKAASPR